MKKIKLLFVAHNFNFLEHITAYFQNLDEYEVKIDKWLSHNIHDEEQSKELLKWADVIICEWGLGNSVWYSKYKKKNQVLIVRMHRFEVNKVYPKKINLQNVNKIIAVSQYWVGMFRKKTKADISKFMMIHNLVDTKALDKEKFDNSEYHLGILGYCPKLKRIDKALDIFEELWEHDRRYKLFIKGKDYTEYSWMQNDEEEAQYFTAIKNRIYSSEWKNSVVFESWSADVSDWYRKIGFILSTSDIESFHLAAAEGMASGSIPIILNWEAAKGIYPLRFIFEKTKDAADFIKKLTEEEKDEYMKYVREYAFQKFDKNKLLIQWKSIIDEELKTVEND